MVKIAAITASIILFSSVVWAGTTIYCPETNEPVYECKFDLFSDLDGFLINVSDFEPYEGVDDISPGSAICSVTCPGSDAPINGYCYWFWKRGRHLPDMPYPAFTFWVRDSDGNFMWKPYDLDLKD